MALFSAVIRFGAIALLAALSWTLPVHAQHSEADDLEARKLFEAGQVAYNEARYERALKYFEQAHALSERHILLYNIGTTLDRLRRDEDAVKAFEAYLEKVPNPSNREAVEERIRVLKENIAAHPRVPSPEQAAQAQLDRERASTVPTGPDQSERRPVYKKWWFWTAIGAVVVAGAAVSIVAATQGSSKSSSDPITINDMTRVRQL